MRRAARALRACLLVLLPPAAAAAPLDPAWLAQVERMAGEAARQAFGARTPTRVEVSAGPLDARLRLAPCGRIEIYWPSGHRPWGRTRVGLRCAQGPVAWNVTAPLTVQVWAPALVTTQPLPAGTLLEERHLRIGETDWAERDAPVLLSAEKLLGRALARPIAAGSAVRADDLKRRQWFAAGDNVRLQAVGPGFSVGGEGTAITPGIEGQTVRVRTESGRVVSGTAVGDRLVELRL
jgi:flagella basal body P-ring formation protein FlgA